MTVSIYEMKHDVSLLGTDLQLWAGQKVIAIPATNLPQGGSFVRPAYAQWPYGGDDDSIHCDGTEFKFWAVDTQPERYSTSCPWLIDAAA